MGGAAVPTARPYTKWYNVHERHSLSEFQGEGIILAIAALIFLFHIVGARTNRSKAKAWMRANAPVLTGEFALVGFGKRPNTDNEDIQVDSLIKEKSLYEFATYASGRQNTAFMDVKLTLAKRFNPIMTGVESVASIVSESLGSPAEAMEAFLYPFDGKENLTIPAVPGAEEVAAAKDSNKSTYDGFVWALVNKSSMKKLREDRYDVTLTATKDNSKLPNWLTVMSESAEVTDTLLTKDLIAAVTSAGDDFDYLIVSDQPTEKPMKLDDAVPRKRLFLKYRLPSSGNYDNLLPIFSHFVRLPDFLVQNARFRPEVLKKVRATREAMVVQIKKYAEEEKNEERLLEKEKSKKLKREADLKGLDAKAQKKYLEKEKEKELRRSQKKMTTRG